MEIFNLSFYRLIEFEKSFSNSDGFSSVLDLKLYLNEFKLKNCQQEHFYFIVFLLVV